MVSLRNKNIDYEWKYWSNRLPFHRVLVIFFSLFGGLIVGFSDARSFFTNEDSLIPQDSKISQFLSNPTNSKIAAIGSILLPTIFVLVSQDFEKTKEISELLQITQDFTLPSLKKDLNEFYDSVAQKFKLSNGCRMYIIQPVRRGVLNWHLRVISHTENVDGRELEISLSLDEGAIGYAFSLTDKKDNLNAQYISLMNWSDLPPGYKQLNHNNKARTRQDIKAYLIIPSFDKDFLNALFVVDTNNPSDLIILQNRDLHISIFDWIGDEPKLLSLLWRLN